MAFIDTKTLKVHHEITVPEVEHRSFECDDLIAPIISVLNKKGYKTNFCCAGHPYPHYEDMYILHYEDTGKAISSTMGGFFPKEDFFTHATVCRKVNPEDIPEEHSFDDIDIDSSRPHSFYYVETDDHIFSYLAYIGFEDEYFYEEDMPFGWNLCESECFYAPEDEFSQKARNTIMQYEFPHNLDVYGFYLQQVSVFMNLLIWAKDLRDLTK